VKFGHPRVYNPWQSDELADLTMVSNELSNQLEIAVRHTNRLVREQRILVAQIRDCYLTVPEQIARMEALDEMGAPQ